jgi:imidazolonepropionase
MQPTSPPPLFFRDAAQLLTLAGPPIPRRGMALGELGILRRGAVLTQGDKILGIGRTRSLEREALRLRAEAIDCRTAIVMPGFVDSHTHLVFADSRVDDYELRLQGKTYEEIARAGGGIQLSAQQVGKASLYSLTKQARKSLARLAAHGTTTVEVKTGYGLEVAEEVKILRVIHRLQKQCTCDIVPTLLALHALPASFRGRRAQYVKTIAERLIPSVARRKQAEFVDCFCDRGAFSVDECRCVLEAGRKLGLVPRIHAEQLVHRGATRLGIEVGAASADHLDKVSAVDIAALARSDVVATLLPGANFHMALKAYPPARKLIAAGAAVALATDFNPGTSPTLNMQFVVALACVQMRMTPAEAIAAATINGAFALRRADRVGSIERGKLADLIVLDVDDYREMPYYFAVNHCLMNVKRGRIIYERR